MKKSYSLIPLFLFSLFCQAQLLITNPGYPQDTTSVSITLDCSKGNQGLFNYADTNDVFVHVGVILGNNPSPWDSVKFVWGTTNGAAKATYLGNNKYKYTIFNIRSFFNIPPAVPIKKMAILFRNGSGGSVQRNSDGSDMYIPIYDSSQYAAKFYRPYYEPRFIPVAEPIIKNVGDQIPVIYSANRISTLRIFFDGVQSSASSGSNIMLDTLLVTTPGAHQIIGSATDGVSTKSDTINFFVSAPTNILPLPSGARDGINYEPGDTSVMLVLYAPNKNLVSVLGDFNNWTESTPYQMNKTPDGLRFWLRITGLLPATEYAYQYIVNSSLKIADPFTEKILDPVNDPFISPQTYPGLKAYPTGKTTGIVSVLQTAEPAYVWQVNNFNRPDKRSLAVYEILLRDFVANHDWQTLKDTIGYIKNLGINAIELMPFNEFEGNISWGYNPSFYFAPDKYYGPKNTLKAFIDECHKQGIAVIMDIALNHSFGQSPLVQLYFDGVANRPDPTNPWFNPVARHAFNVGYDMNHENPATKYLTARIVEHWLAQYKLDGFRFDLSKGFTQKTTCDSNGNTCNVAQWGNYDSSRVNIWKSYYDTIQARSNGAYVILEHFADNSEEKDLSDYGMMLWGNMSTAFEEASMGYLPGSNFEQGLFTERGWTNPNLVTYMESHDEERLMYKNINFGNSSGAYNIKEINTGLRRDEMASAFLLMMPGPKLIWQFGETGYDYSINTCQDSTVNQSCRTDPKPIRWDYLQTFYRKRLAEEYTSLLKLRQHPLFKNDFVSNRIAKSLLGAFKWLKVTTDTSDILVIGNFDVVPTTGPVTFQIAGTWYDYLTGQTFNATGAAQNINLQPGEYHVYLNRNVTSILTPVRNIDFSGNIARLTVFPNPALASATIKYELPQSGQVSISLINVNGQLVKNLYSGFAIKGIHYLPINSYSASIPVKGTYFIQLESGSIREVQKLIVQ